MASATVGYACDAGANIWKTTDGGDNWTDTTDDFGTSQMFSLVSTDTDTVYAIDNNNAWIQKYVNSTNTVSNVIELVNIAAATSNLVVASNGWICAVIIPASVDQDAGQASVVIYDGTSTHIKPIFCPVDFVITKWFGTNYNIQGVIEVGGSLYINFTDTIMSVPIF
jgi:hypothetical protein